MKTQLLIISVLSALTVKAQITNSANSLIQSATERDQVFGKVIGDSTINDPDSLVFKYNNKEAFYEAALSDNSLLHLGNNNDLLYQQEFATIEQSNIGKYKEVKEHLQNQELLMAQQKLAAIVDENLKEQNLKTVNSIIALLYDPAMDADSDTVAVLTGIAYQHPFYGGEAVYWARAILRLNITDELPPMRRSHTTTSKNVESKNGLIGRLQPNPAKGEATFIYPHTEEEIILLKIVDIHGKVLSEYQLLGNEVKLNLTNYKQAVYFIHVYLNGVKKEVHKIAVIH